MKSQVKNGSDLSTLRNVWRGSIDDFIQGSLALLRILEFILKTIGSYWVVLNNIKI
jgi:hypothetical protein